MFHDKQIKLTPTMFLHSYFPNQLFHSIATESCLGKQINKHNEIAAANRHIRCKGNMEPKFLDSFFPGTFKGLIALFTTLTSYL